MTIELLETIFTGVKITKIAGAYEARYKDHRIIDDDLLRLAQKLWEANA